VNIDIIIRSLFKRAGADEARAAMQQTAAAADGLAAKGGEAGKALDQADKSASTSAKGGMLEFRRAAGDAQMMAEAMRRTLQGGAASFTGLAAAARITAGTVASGFGVGGIVALALGASIGLLAELAKKFTTPKASAEDLEKQIARTRVEAEKLAKVHISELDEGFKKTTAQATEVEAGLARQLALRERIADAMASAAVATVRAAQASGAIGADEAASQIGAIELNRKLGRAESEIARAGIAVKGEAVRAEGARASDFGMRSAYETQREASIELAIQLKDLKESLALLSTPGRFPGLGIKGAGLSEYESELEKQIAKVEQRQAANSAALLETSKKLGDSRERLWEAEDRLRKAIENETEIRNALGKPGQPGTILGAAGDEDAAARRTRLSQQFPQLAGRIRSAVGGLKGADVDAVSNAAAAFGDMETGSAMQLFPSLRKLAGRTDLSADQRRELSDVWQQGQRLQKEWTTADDLKSAAKDLKEAAAKLKRF
jgi:hypothetical protein